MVAELLPTVVSLRRAIHRQPELAHEEYKTTELVVDELRRHGLSPRTRTPRTGLTVEIGSGRPAVGFRADLDALPIQEPEGLDFRSEIPSVMHACGHDVHTAVGTGVALALARLEPLPGKVRVLFQPAEETFPGRRSGNGARGRGRWSRFDHRLPRRPRPSPAGRVGLRSGADHRIGRPLLHHPGGPRRSHRPPSSHGRPDLCSRQGHHRSPCPRRPPDRFAGALWLSCSEKWRAAPPTT